MHARFRLRALGVKGHALPQDDLRFDMVFQKEAHVRRQLQRFRKRLLMHIRQPSQQRAMPLHHRIKQLPRLFGKLFDLQSGDHPIPHEGGPSRLIGKRESSRLCRLLKLRIHLRKQTRGLSQIARLVPQLRQAEPRPRPQREPNVFTSGQGLQSLLRGVGLPGLPQQATQRQLRPGIRRGPCHGRLQLLACRFCIAHGERRDHPQMLPAQLFFRRLHGTEGLHRFLRLPSHEEIQRTKPRSAGFLLGYRRQPLAVGGQKRDLRRLLVIPRLFVWRIPFESSCQLRPPMRHRPVIDLRLRCHHDLKRTPQWRGPGPPQVQFIDHAVSRFQHLQLDPAILWNNKLQPTEAALVVGRHNFLPA